jgi:lipid-A-disaccharide synthetase
VVCYKTPVPGLIRFAFKHIIKVAYISLVNLIVNREVVSELFADRFSVDNITCELSRLLPGEEGREQMLTNYVDLVRLLGNDVAPDNAAQLMYIFLHQKHLEIASKQYKS